MSIQHKTAISKVASIVLIVVVVAAGAAFAAYFLSGSGSNCGTTSVTTAAPATVEISIPTGASNSGNGPGYAPDTVKVVIGVNNTVTWSNLDSAAHTVTSVSSPSSCSAFNSGNMNPGAKYTHTFTLAGTYKYHCQYHSWMSGTVIVES
jgi:plastocyanin